jgi:hypothetical protein
MATRRALLPLALLALVGLVGGETSSALAAKSEAVERVKVKAAGISLLIPDSYDITHWTRKKANAYVKNNPSAAASGTTVESLLKQPLVANLDLNADGSADRSIVVGYTAGPRSPTSPGAMRESLTELGYHDITTARATVAGRDGVVANFTRDAPAAGGSTFSIVVREYAFPAGSGVTEITFSRRPDDAAFDKSTRRIIKSVQILH